MTPSREFHPVSAVITVVLLFVCVRCTPISAGGIGMAVQKEVKKLYDVDDVSQSYLHKANDATRFRAMLRRQSPNIIDTDSSGEGRHRMKRHTADHLINDRYSRNIQSHVRKQILSKLLNLVGSSPDNPCSCESSRTANLVEGGGSRLKDRTRGLTKRLDSTDVEDIDCNCDMPSLISFLIRRLSHHGRSDPQRHKADPLTDYVSRLSGATKIRLAYFLREEALRIKRYEILRKRRRQRQQLQLIQRRRLLLKDPNAAFRGKIFLSF